MALGQRFEMRRATKLSGMSRRSNETYMTCERDDLTSELGSRGVTSACLWVLFVWKPTLE
jgi:hypothetical protein